MLISQFPSRRTTSPSPRLHRQARCGDHVVRQALECLNPRGEAGRNVVRQELLPDFLRAGGRGRQPEGFSAGKTGRDPPVPAQKSGGFPPIGSATKQLDATDVSRMIHVKINLNTTLQKSSAMQKSRQPLGSLSIPHETHGSWYRKRRFHNTSLLRGGCFSRSAGSIHSV